MDIKTIIAKKRKGGPKSELERDEIRYFVGKWVKEEITDGQAAALLSYIYMNGLTENEITMFAEEVGNSGNVLDMSEISDKIVDKHSTGGIGDKVTLILLPIIAALGLPVAKITSRGLGIAGGTLDKLAAIPGFNPFISLQEFKDNVENIGISIVGQEMNLAPAEKKLYHLRNEIACGDSIALIAISLMSLKVATGTNKIVFELTCGKGTYLKNADEAKRLGKLLVKLGKSLNKDVGYIVTGMDEPVGNCIGNILEMKETIEALKGNMAKDIEETVMALANILLTLYYGEKNIEENTRRIKEVIDSGEALMKFRQMIIAQRRKSRIY